MSAFVIAALGAMILSTAIPLAVWLVSRKAASISQDPQDQHRAVALPFFGNGSIPQDRALDHEDDKHTLSAIVSLLLRSWPFIKPQLLGTWFVPGEGTGRHIADSVGGGGYSLFYAPFAVTSIAFFGPLLGLVPVDMVYPLNLLYYCVFGMTLGMWTLVTSDTNARIQAVTAIALAVCGLATLLIAALVVDGMASLLYAVLVVGACIMGWMVQLKTSDGSIQVRIRVHAHLAYFYIMIGIQGFIALAMGLIIADLLSQSLMLGEPLMPGLANFFGHPEWARGYGLADLTIEQRHELKYYYVYLTFGLWVLNLPIGVVTPYYHVWIMQRINQDLRLALVERWHQLSLSYHNDHRTGDSIYRIYQDSAQVTAVIGQLAGVVTTIWGYFMALVLLTFLSPTMGLVGATLLVPAFLWGRWAMPRMRTKSLIYRGATSDVTSRAHEVFASIRLIKAYGVEDKAQKEMEQDSIVAFNAAFQARLLVALVTIVMFSIAALFMLAGEFYMAIMANRGNETFARELIALMGFSFVVWNLGAFEWAKGKFHETTGSVRGVMRQWLTAQDMAMGLVRVFDILDVEPDIKDRADAVTLSEFRQNICFDNVHFCYQSDRRVLAGVSFSVKPSSVTAIVGPTGSGKSTLMGMLLRLYDPQSGVISIDGLSLDGYSVDSLRKNVAIALQENVLFALSVRENIRYVVPDASDQQVEEAIKVSCMDDFVAGLPEGIDTILGDRGGKLSTGQRQRLSIARAVVRDTPILILDEPTAALDAATEHRVMTNLAEWGRGRAIFLITHRISTIRRAENIIYLDGGCIVEEGNHDSLMCLENGRYRSFVETESGLSDGLVEV